MTKIYTKTGDKGTTGIIGGRLSKTSKIIEALGSLDELNATLGIIVSIKDIDADIAESLIYLQNKLFSLGGLLAGGKVTLDLAKETENLEKEIDEMTAELAELKNFILPGGHEVSARIHHARTIARKAERRVAEFYEAIDNEITLASHNKLLIKSKLEVLSYLNRLSDYLFTLARFVNNQNGVADVEWQK